VFKETRAEIRETLRYCKQTERQYVRVTRLYISEAANFNSLPRTGVATAQDKYEYKSSTSIKSHEEINQ
jgi:hypothetical protein